MDCAQEWWLPGVGGEGNGNHCLTRDGVSVWEDKKVLKMNVGDSCITMQMYLMSLNCTLKNSKFYDVYILLHFFKNGEKPTVSG